MAKAEARHILVPTEEECNNLKTEIEGGADFADVAKKHSKCPSGEKDRGTEAAGATARNDCSVPR